MARADILEMETFAYFLVPVLEGLNAVALAQFRKNVM